MDKSNITNYLLGQSSEEQVRELFQWINESEENRKEFIELKKIWSLTSTSQNDVVQEWIEFKEKKEKLISTPFISRRFLQVAALIAIIFALGVVSHWLVFENTQQKEYYSSNSIINVPQGEMSKLTLPDGTSVIINSGSTFSYSSNYKDGKRIVELTGEAFFNVAKDPDHPFIIKTNLMNFKVYGTSFNIEAYPDNNQVSTTLVEGSLGFIDKNEKELGRLVPGENLLFDGKNNNFKITNVDLDLFTSWKDGIITFRNEKLKDVAIKLERWYNVKIVIKNPKLADELYYGTVMKNKPIDQILEVLSITSSLNYQMTYRNEQPTLIYWE